MYDVIVIGAGPGGYRAALNASKGGLSTLLIDKGEPGIGGVCLNEGCVPTKTLLYSAKMYDGIVNGAKYGVSAANVAFDHEAVIKRKNKTVRILTAGVKSALKDAGVTCLEARARLRNGSDGLEVVCGSLDGGPGDGAGAGAGAPDARLSDGAGLSGAGAGDGAGVGAAAGISAGSGAKPGDGSGAEAGAEARDGAAVVYKAKNIVIATGSSAIIPPIKGVAECLSSGYLLTNREALNIPAIPKSLMIIGGGVIGLEMAYYFACVGTRVIVADMLPKIGGPLDSELSEALLGELRKKGIDFALEARITEIREGSVVYEQRDERKEVFSEKALMSIGRSPNLRGLGLEEAGILFERSGIITNDACETNIKGVYAIGDVNGKITLAHTAYREADVCVNNILGIPDAVDYANIPSVIYTNPEIASVGETEQSAAAKGLEYDVIRLPMRHSGRYLAENEGGNGICKIIVSKPGKRLLGAHMIGNYASEIIYGAGMMIQSEMTAADIGKVVFPHPSVGEVIRDAVEAISAKK